MVTPCPDCGYKKKHIHEGDDCPMCKNCTECDSSLMDCNCIEGE